jgi:hypothetical protein
MAVATTHADCLKDCLHTQHNMLQNYAKQSSGFQVKAENSFSFHGKLSAISRELIADAINRKPSIESLHPST